MKRNFLLTDDRLCVCVCVRIVCYCSVVAIVVWWRHARPCACERARNNVWRVWRGRFKSSSLLIIDIDWLFVCLCCDISCFHIFCLCVQCVWLARTIGWRGRRRILCRSSIRRNDVVFIIIVVIVVIVIVKRRRWFKIELTNLCVNVNNKLRQTNCTDTAMSK